MAQSPQQTAVHFNYISDNPYRLLGVGSSTLQVELRQKANRAVQAAQVGLRPRVGLDRMFGDDVRMCADIVRSVSNDPEKRTLYRIFWPLDYHQSDLSTGSINDIQTILAERKNARQSPSHSQTSLFDDDPEDKEPFADTQIRFLLSWYSFEATSASYHLANALTIFEDLYYDQDFDNRLFDLLESEGDVVEIERVYNAESAAIRHLAESACKHAAEAWKGGRCSNAIDILKVASHSGIFWENEYIDKAILNYIRPLGERQAETIRGMVSTLQQSPTRVGLDGLVRQANDLSTLAQASATYIPDADGWDLVSGSAIQAAKTAQRARQDQAATPGHIYDWVEPNAPKQQPAAPKQERTTQTPKTPPPVPQRSHNGCGIRSIYGAFVLLCIIVGLLSAAFQYAEDTYQTRVISSHFGSGRSAYADLASAELPEGRDVSGRFLPINSENGHIDREVYFSLPKEMRARSRSDVGMVVFVKWGSEHACYYSLEGHGQIEGRRQTCKIRIINVRKRTLWGTDEFVAPDPPSSISRSSDESSPETSTLDVDDIAGYLSTL